MRKNPSIFSGILFILLLVYFSGSQDIYASKTFFSYSYSKKSQSKSSDYIDSGRPRDFKISDDNESENFTASDNKFPNISSSQSFDKTPWVGPLLVVIDPGHGGSEPGAVENGLVEKDITLDVSKRVNILLQQAGIETYMTRDSDSAVDLKERIYIANRKNAALFLSIHSNWYHDNSYRGVMTLYAPSPSLYAGFLSEFDYALTLQEELMKALKVKDRGVIDRPNLAVLRHAKMPTAVVELGFLSNSDDVELLSSESFKQKTAEALAEGVKRSLGKITAE